MSASDNTVPDGWGSVLEAVEAGHAVEIHDCGRLMIEILPPARDDSSILWRIRPRGEDVRRKEGEETSATAIVRSAARWVDVLGRTARTRPEDLRAFRVDDLGAHEGRNRLVMRRIPFGADDALEAREAHLRAKGWTERGDVWASPEGQTFSRSAALRELARREEPYNTIRINRAG